MQYHFRCQDCGGEGDSEEFAGIGQQHSLPCLACGGKIVRIVSMTIVKGYGEHFNHSIGEYCRDEKDFREKLKIKADETAERLGMDCHWQPVDPDDQRGLGVTDEGLDESASIRRKQGLDPAPTRRIFV